MINFLNKKIFTTKSILIIFFIFLLFGGIFYWLCPDAKNKSDLPVIQTPEDKLTAKEIMNAEYLGYSDEGAIKLEDGYYFKQWTPDSATGLLVLVDEEDVFFGDLNNDNQEDAAVIVASSGGGSGVFYELTIMLNKNGEPFFLTSESLGDRVIVNSMNIQSGVITLNMMTHASGDGLCCPSLEKVFQYQLSGDQLIKISEEKVIN